MNLNNTTFAVYVGTTDLESVDVTFSSLSRFVGGGANLFAVDNASGHGSYFAEKGIPVHSFAEEKPKTSVLNWVFKNCQTQYLVLLETDMALFSRFFDTFQPTHSIHGNVIEASNLSVPDSVFIFMDGLASGLVILDVALLRSKGITVFDDESDHLETHVYHFGSWLLKKASEAGAPALDYEPSSQDLIPFVRNYHAKRRQTFSVGDQILIYTVLESVFGFYGLLGSPLTQEDRAKLNQILSMDVNYSGPASFTQVPITLQYE